MNYKITFLTLIFCFFICGCKSKKEHEKDAWQAYAKDKIETLIGSIPEFPDTIPSFPDSSTVATILSMDFKIIICVEADCSICISKFNYWKGFISNMQNEIGFEVPILAVISGQRHDMATEDYIEMNWPYPWIYDLEGDFIFTNDLEDDRFQAFLLDKDNIIRVVGDPIHNPKMVELYKKWIRLYNGEA